MTAICLLFTAVCLAEEENQVDVTLEGYMEAGGLLNVTWTEDAGETGGLGMIGTPGQTIGEVLELYNIAAITAEGKTFVGWMVYEYDVETMETSETCVEEEGVLCFELFEDYHMVLRDYTSCTDPLSTEELAEYVCEGSDHVVVAIWKTTEEYLTSVKEQADAIKASLEQDDLTQTNVSLLSEELRALWDKALNYLLDEAKKTLPEAEMEKLTAEQSAWEADMEAAVEAAAKEYEGGSIHTLVINSEAAKLTQERVYELYELLK